MRIEYILLFCSSSSNQLTINNDFTYSSRFSHGENVRYIDLKQYNKPNFSLLNQIKHPVLAKQSDNIWYKGRVTASNFIDKTCQIKFDYSKKESTCAFHDILPIEEGSQSH